MSKDLLGCLHTLNRDASVVLHKNLIPAYRRHCHQDLMVKTEAFSNVGCPLLLLCFCFSSFPVSSTSSLFFLLLLLLSVLLQCLSFEHLSGSSYTSSFTGWVTAKAKSKSFLKSIPKSPCAMVVCIIKPHLNGEAVKGIWSYYAAFPESPQYANSGVNPWARCL